MRLWGWWRCRHEGRILVTTGQCLDCWDYVPVAQAEINAMVLPPPLSGHSR